MHKIFKKFLLLYESFICYYLIILGAKYYINCLICKKKLENFKIFRWGVFFLKYKICKKCNHLTQSPQIKNLNFYYNKIYRSFRKNDLQGIFEREKRRGAYIINYMNESRVPLKSKNVLEWGCGSGGILYQFKKILNCSVVGFDLNKRSAETGMQLSAGHITILNNLVNNVIKKSFFDIIILSHSLEHFPCPESDLKKILTFLKKGGYIYIELPGIDNSRVYNHNYTAQPGHLNIFSIKSLTSLCDNLNLEKVSINKKIQSIFCKR